MDTLFVLLRTEVGVLVVLATVVINSSTPRQPPQAAASLGIIGSKAVNKFAPILLTTVAVEILTKYY